MLSLDEYEWKQANLDTAEKSYFNMDRDLLYIADTWNNGQETTQTDFDDMQEDRYEVRLRRQYQPVDTDDQVLHSSMDWEEADQFLEATVE